MTRVFLITASRDHLERGIANGFIQQKRPNRIENIKKGDKIVLYASKIKYESQSKLNKCNQIVGIGTATNDDFLLMDATQMAESLSIPTTNISKDKIFYRKTDIEYDQDFKPKDIKDLIPELSFVKNKTKWGFYFMSGFREIPLQDFHKIKEA